jgi:hypothetical protein
MTITSGGALNAMGGGTVMRAFMPACAMVVMGIITANARSIIPKSAFFNLVPPDKITQCSSTDCRLYRTYSNTCAPESLSERSRNNEIKTE